MIYIKDIEKKRNAYNRKSMVALFIAEKPATYSDTDCTQLQCERGRFRSVTELLEIVKTKFPRTTLDQILAIIKDLIASDNNIGLVWCTQVRKVVLKYGVDKSQLTASVMTAYSKERYYSEKGVDGYSLKDYETIINKL